MKKIPLFICPALLVFLSSFPESILAQCTIDSTQTVAGVYPDTLPDATANQYYTTDITFVMKTDTLGFTISNYHITNVSGLPVGLNWQCNNFANGCNYDPTVNLYGCANVSGTPLVAGSYVAHVTVIATVAVVGDQTVDYPIPITVLPSQVTNPGFGMANSSGCEPLTVSFTNNNPGQATYLWNFGDGIQSTLENPLPHTYPTAGDYIVTQTVTPNIVPDFYLTSVTVNSIPDNYGGIADDPDMYLLLADSSGGIVYDSRPAQNGLFPPQTWSVPNIFLNDETYTIHVWDEDGGLFGADDDLGVISFAGHGSSGNATATVNGATGSLNLDYVIFETPVVPLVAVDTVHVYPSQAVPLVAASGPVSFCAGDSVILTSSEPIGNQWYENGNLSAGDTNQTLIVHASGIYTVTTTNTYGCSATSSPADTVVVHPLPPRPNILIAGDSLKCLLTGYTYQWFLNDTAIAGETNSYVVPPTTGNYTVMITTVDGCSNTSNPLYYFVTSINNLQSTLHELILYPNPFNGALHIDFETEHSNESMLVIKDILGKIVFEKILGCRQHRFHETIDLSSLQAGVYFFQLNMDDTIVLRKIVKE